MKGTNRISQVIMAFLFLVLLFLPLNYFNVIKRITMMHHDADVVNALGFVRGSIQRLIVHKMSELDLEAITLETELKFKSVKEYVLFDDDYTSYVQESGFLSKYDHVYDAWKHFYKDVHQAHPKELEVYSKKYWNMTDNLILVAIKMIERKQKDFLSFIIISNILAGVILLFMIYFVHHFVKNELEKNVIVDPLTKLYNRFYFNYFLESQLAYFDRSNEELALLFIDIDHFKKVNDTYGHKMGDKVLEEVASIILKHLRKEDTGFRFGGEEFIVTLPNCGQEQAAMISQRLLAEVSSHKFAFKDQLTISIGLTLYRKNEKMSLFIERADQAMYAAKKNGRNQVKID